MISKNNLLPTNPTPEVGIPTSGVGLVGRLCKKIDGAHAMPEAGAGANSVGDKLFGDRYRGKKVFPFGKLCGDGRRVSATGAMRVPCPDPRSFEKADVPILIKKIDGVSF